MFHIARNLSPALRPNYSEFPNSCPCVEFAFLINVMQVLVYGREPLPWAHGHSDDADFGGYGQVMPSEGKWC